MKRIYIYVAPPISENFHYHVKDGELVLFRVNRNIYSWRETPTLELLPEDQLCRAVTTACNNVTLKFNSETVVGTMVVLCF